MSSKQYLKKLEGTSTPIATRYKPAFSDSEYTGFGELYRNGKWYKDVAVFADDFDSDTTSNYTAGNSTLSIADSRMKVVDAGVSAGVTASFSLIEGKKYRLITKVTSGTAQVNVVLYNNPNEQLLLNSYGETVTHDFIASSSVAAYYYNTNGVTGEYVFIESIVVIPLNDDGSIDISNATELTTPQTYLPIECDVDEQGNLLNVDRMDLPTLVEDYVSTRKASIETLNIGDFRNIDGSELNVWSERNSFGIRNVQYVQLDGTSNISTNSTNAFVDVSGLTLTVTPSKENSKFLITYQTNWHINMNTPNYGGESVLYANGVATNIRLTFQGSKYSTIYNWYTNTLSTVGIYQADTTAPITFQVKHFMISGGNYSYFYHSVDGSAGPSMTIIELEG